MWFGVQSPMLFGLIGVFVAAGAVWIGITALWAWRQSKVDLIAPEEKIQAKRAKDSTYEVAGFTGADDVTSARQRVWQRYWGGGKEPRLR